MNLVLTRPIVFFDLETTGTSIMRDRIVEISIIKVMPDGSEIERTLRVNPGMPIPAEATAIHHITDADVADAPTFSMIAAELMELFCRRGYRRIQFQPLRCASLLTEEFLRAGIAFDLSKRRFIDVQTIFHKMEQRTLVAAYKFYCGKDLTEAHSANADTRATYEVLKAQLDCYDTLKNDVAYLAEFSTQNKNVDLMGRIIRNDAGTEVFNFGKYKGQPVEEVFRRDIGYYSWMMQGEFPANTKQVITAIKMRLK